MKLIYLTLAFYHCAALIYETNANDKEESFEKESVVITSSSQEYPSSQEFVGNFLKKQETRMKRSRITKDNDRPIVKESDMLTSEEDIEPIIKIKDNGSKVIINGCFTKECYKSTGELLLNENLCKLKMNLSNCKIREKNMFDFQRFCLGLSKCKLEELIFDNSSINNLTSFLTLSLSNLQLSKLSLFNVGMNNFDLASLSTALKYNTYIFSLCLRDNSFDCQGIMCLSGALRNHQSITTLDISLNSIRKKGIESLASMLRTNTVIETLDISEPSDGDIIKFKEKSLRLLREALTLNTYVVLEILRGGESHISLAAQAQLKRQFGERVR